MYLAGIQTHISAGPLVSRSPHNVSPVAPVDSFVSTGGQDPVQASIARAQTHLWSLQRADGSWQSRNQMGVADTARGLVFEQVMGIARAPDTAESVRFVSGLQRPDGSFPPYPQAGEGDLTTSCLAYAGLRAAGLSESDPRVAAVRQWIDTHGGLEGARPDARIFLALAGVERPEALDNIPLTYKLIPGFERWLGKRMASWVPLNLNMIPPLIRALKRGGKPLNPWLHPIQALQDRNVVRYLSSHQNPTGDTYGVATATMLSTMCMHALGVPLADPRIQNALTAWDQYKKRDASGLWVTPFNGEVWDTALVTRALLASGVPPSDPRLVKAAQFMAADQSRVPMPRDWQNPPRESARTGGWSFGTNNPLATDNDTTAAVLHALTPVAPHAGADVQAAVDRGLDRTLAMQNRQGGWGAWSRGHSPKEPGPMPPHWLSEMIGNPMILTDPATEGLTGRVLQMLGETGRTAQDEEVARAIDFLQSQAEPSGAFWERWGVNYVMGTSFVLSGLAAVQYDMQQPWVQRAADWLLTVQNADGSFGETAASYDDPSQAGVGPPSPVLTGLAVGALVDAGRGDHPAVQRAVDWLLKNQNAAGTWDEDAARGVAFPSLKQYYHNSLFASYYPLLGLAKFSRRGVGARDSGVSAPDAGARSPDVRIPDPRPPDP